MDVARALAVFGMFTVHLGVGAIGVFGDGAADTLHEITRGRSSALFAFLAGVSLALMTGRTLPLRGQAVQRARARILVRALVLALLGGVLDTLGAPIAVILTYYGGFFLLALPLLRLRALALTATAAAVALLGPQVSFLVRSAMEEDPYRPTSIGGVADFLLTGYYPACTFMAFVIAGMAVGRLDLGSVRVRAGMAGTGAGLAALGYGGSWVLMNPLGGLDRLVAAQILWADGAAAAEADPALLASVRQWTIDQIGGLHGQVPADSAWWLLVASPHSGTTFEIAGAIGTSLLVLAACVAVADIAGPPLYPLAAAGAMALTVYTGHIMVIAGFGFSHEDTAPFRLEAFIVGALVLAALWRLLLGRGPLERALGRLTDRVSRLVPLEEGAGPGRAGPGHLRG